MSAAVLQPLNDTMLSSQSEDTMELQAFDSMFPAETASHQDEGDVYFDEDTVIFSDISPSVSLTDAKAVQFVGAVGVGERSIRTEKPISKPKTVITRKTVKVPPPPQPKGRKLSFRRKQPKPQEQEIVKETISFEPFVEPFMLSSGEMCDKPRMITYFETEIMPAPEEVKPEEVPEPTKGKKAECIAIGMSTKRFNVRKSMPGWDKSSYGLHGDDGTAFFRSKKTREYCPSGFGADDVVGCGVDYQTKRIFYTLNGQFLGFGYKMDNYDLKDDWFPTIGLDTHARVQCNFGRDKHFVFDLQSMIEIGEPEVNKTRPVILPEDSSTTGYSSSGADTSKGDTEAVSRKPGRDEEQATYSPEGAAVEKTRGLAETPFVMDENTMADELEVQRAKQELVEAERIAAEENEEERLAAEIEAKRLEEERVAAAAAETERFEQEQIAAEAKRLEEERIAAEAQMRIAAELAAKRLEEERVAAEEAERLEQERISAELEAKRLEEERLEAERLEQERLAAEAEAKRIEEERLEQERFEQERLAAEAEAKRIEEERLEQERFEQERLAAEAEAKRIEEERLEAEQLEQERLAAEAEAKRIEEERLEQEHLEQERLAAEAEAKRIEEERLEQERLAAELEAKRIEEERMEQERLAAEAEAKRIEEERMEQERLAAEAEAKRIEEERLEQERLAAELEAKRIAEEILAAEVARLEAERAAEEARLLEEERIAAEAEAKRIAEEKVAAEAQRLELERIAEEEVEARRLEEERLAAEAEVKRAEEEMMEAETRSLVVKEDSASDDLDAKEAGVTTEEQALEDAKDTADQDEEVTDCAIVERSLVVDVSVHSAFVNETMAIAKKAAADIADYVASGPTEELRIATQNAITKAVVVAKEGLDIALQKSEECISEIDSRPALRNTALLSIGFAAGAATAGVLLRSIPKSK